MADNNNIEWSKIGSSHIYLMSGIPSKENFFQKLVQSQLSMRATIRKTLKRLPLKSSIITLSSKTFPENKGKKLKKKIKASTISWKSAKVIISASFIIVLPMILNLFKCWILWEDNRLRTSSVRGVILMNFNHFSSLNSYCQQCLQSRRKIWFLGSLLARIFDLLMGDIKLVTFHLFKMFPLEK